PVWAFPKEAASVGLACPRRTRQAADQELLDIAPEPEVAGPFRLGQLGQLFGFPDAGQRLLTAPALQRAADGRTAVWQVVEPLRPHGQIGPQPVKRLFPPAGTL